MNLTWRDHLPGEDVAALLADTGQRLAEKLSELPELLDTLKIRRPVLVLDQSALKASGLEAELRVALTQFAVVEFSGFTPNPKSEQVAAAATLAASHRADGLVAVGGGSCLDVAKVASIACGAGARLEEVTRGEHSPTGALPVVAVPTTSGTGSEATRFAAIYVDGHKVSVEHPGMRPSGAVLDLRLHLAMPPRLASETGLDALAQAMESMWAVGATRDSERFAEAAGRLVHGALVQSAVHGHACARASMMLGAHLAGQAINLSKTTAAHALSYALTQQFGIAHGHAVALNLGQVCRINHEVSAPDCIDPRGPEHVRTQVERGAALAESSPANLPAALRLLMRQLQLPATLSEAGVPREALPSLAAAADAVRLSNNPRRLDNELALRVLTDAYCDSE